MDCPGAVVIEAGESLILLSALTASFEKHTSAVYIERDIWADQLLTVSKEKRIYH